MRNEFVINSDIGFGADFLRRGLNETLAFLLTYITIILIMHENHLSTLSSSPLMQGKTFSSSNFGSERG